MKFNKYSSIKEQYAAMHSLNQNENDNIEEDINEIAIYSPRGNNNIDENTILWDNIDDKLKDAQDLDEDEILELRHEFEQKKREALIKDMLSYSDVKNIDPTKLKMLSKNKKPLDSVLENTNSRKNFMIMWKQSDKTIECEELQRSPDFHYFKKWMEANVLPLPAISKINDGSLMLVGYTLNEGLWKALHYGIEKYEGKIK